MILGSLARAIFSSRDLFSRGSNCIRNNCPRIKCPGPNKLLILLSLIQYIFLPSEPGEHALHLYNELKIAYPDHLPVHTAMLTSLDSPEARRHLPHDDLSESAVSFADQMIDVANAVISAIDQEKLLAFYGMKADQRADASKIKTTMDKQKTCLIEALVKKGCALARIYINAERKGQREAPNYLRECGETWNDVQKYAEPTDLKVSYHRINDRIFFKLCTPDFQNFFLKLLVLNNMRLHI